MYVGEIMTKDVAVCSSHTNIKDCANLMVENDCGEIPVVEGEGSQKLVGVITDRDITCRVVAKGLDPSVVEVKDYMTKNIYTVKEKDDLERCYQLMSENQVRRLPVIDDSMNCIGIISQAHAARHSSEQKAGELAKDLSRSHSSADAPTQNTLNM